MTTKLKIVMFTDQVQSTQNTANRTSSEIEQISRQQEELTLSVLRLTSGRMLQDTGDGCLAEFTSVIAAVQAGILLQERVAQRNKMQQHPQMQFTLHIGIDVGELVVLENGNLRGDAANRCARICSECPPGQVYLSEAAAKKLKDKEVAVSFVGGFSLKGLEGITNLYSVVALLIQSPEVPNPFIWRNGITITEDFFNRDNEQSKLRSFLHGKQNCQVVGPRRIGKTSLLRQIMRMAPVWIESCVVAYLDFQDPRCFNLSGWLHRASRQFRWSSPAGNLSEFADYVEDMSLKNLHPVLCLDEFNELEKRRSEFDRDFYLTLRSCGQQGMSIITASHKQLIEITDHSDPSSPFYNIFPLLSLEPFSETDAEDFVTLYRSGVPTFQRKEKIAILKFAKNHPLALQVACFHVLEASRTGENLDVALRKAEKEVRANLSSGW
jgi:class 3 adenylate cyclase